jgi:L-cysteine desulfidase
VGSFDFQGLSFVCAGRGGRRDPKILRVVSEYFSRRLPVVSIYSSTQEMDWVGHEAMAVSTSASVFPVGLMTSACVVLIAKVAGHNEGHVPQAMHVSALTTGFFIRESFGDLYHH